MAQDVELEQLSVMGLPVHWGMDYPQWLLQRHRRGQGSHVVTLNAEMAMQGEQTPRLAQLIHSADLVIPDGAGIVLFFRIKGRKIRRTPGIEVAAAVLKQLSPQESVVFYGGAPGVAQQALTHWQSRGYCATATAYHGYLSAEAMPQLLEQLRTQQPSVVLVGLGVPRQEYWIAEHRHLCPQAIWIGVGGSFDIWAGVKTRAPAWMGDNHLEWLYRLYKEPWRWRRMLALPQFAWRALRYRD